LTLVGSGGSYLLLLEEGTQGFCKQEENKTKQKQRKGKINFKFS